MSVIRDAEARRTETPNATMTTLASPTLGGAGRALWRVAMEPGAAGLEHRFEVEQIWTVLAGGAELELDGRRLALAVGDTAVIPAGTTRRVVAGAGGPTALAHRRLGRPGDPARGHRPRRPGLVGLS